MKWFSFFTSTTVLSSLIQREKDRFHRYWVGSQFYIETQYIGLLGPQYRNNHFCRYMPNYGNISKTSKKNLKFYLTWPSNSVVIGYYQTIPGVKLLMYSQKSRTTLFLTQDLSLLPHFSCAQSEWFSRGVAAFKLIIYNY